MPTSIKAQISKCEQTAAFFEKKAIQNLIIAGYNVNDPHYAIAMDQLNRVASCRKTAKYLSRKLKDNLIITFI